MSINANYLVSITPRVVSAGSADLETNGLVLTTNPLIPADAPALSFGTAEAVGNFFGPESPEAEFANQYFSGVNNQQKGISALWVARRVNAAAAAWVRGVPSATLAELKAVTAGGFKITVNGTEVTVSALDLSAATSWSAMATAIATAIGNTVTGAYDSNLGAFIFTTVSTGDEASISFASSPASGTDLSAMLGLTEASGAVLSSGSDALPAAQNMNLITHVTRNWVGFTTLYSADEAEAVALAAWADIDDDYVYFDWTTDANVLTVSTQSTTKPVALADYNCVASIYGDQQEAAFFLAVGASIDWTREQGIKTWFAKATSGIHARITDDSEAAALDGIRCNYIGEFATRNAEFRLLNRGCLTGNYYGWLDSLYGAIWFKARIQRSIMDGFSANNRVPYNARGYALIEAWLMDPIIACKKNGIIDTGLALSQSQKAQIANEAGQDISDVLYSQGYWYSIEDPDAAVRSERGSPVIGLWYTYAGSVQRIEMPLTQIQ